MELASVFNALPSFTCPSGLAIRRINADAVLQPCVDAATLAKDSRANTDSKAGNFDRTRSAHQADVHCALPQNTESARLVCSLRAWVCPYFDIGPWGKSEAKFGWFLAWNWMPLHTWRSSECYDCTIWTADYKSGSKDARPQKAHCKEICARLFKRVGSFELMN